MRKRKSFAKSRKARFVKRSLEVWYVRPVGPFTNEHVSTLVSAREHNALLCLDGEKRNLFSVSHEDVKNLIVSKVQDPRFIFDLFYSHRVGDKPKKAFYPATSVRRGSRAFNRTLKSYGVVRGDQIGRPKRPKARTNV